MLPIGLLCLVLSGAAIEVGEVEFLPGPMEAGVPELFRLAGERFGYELEPLRTTGTYRVSALRFPSPIETADPENNTVHAEYFEPIGGGAGRRPAVVVLHILGADFALSRYL